VVLKEVPLHTDVFSLLADQGILGVRDGALVVLLDSGGFGDGNGEDLPHKLTEVESLLDGVNRRVKSRFASGLGHTSLLFRLVAYGSASEGKEIARTRLASVVVVCPVRVGKAYKLVNVVRASPQRKAHIDSAMEISKDLVEDLHANLRGIGMGGAKSAQRRGNIRTRGDCRVLKAAEEAGVDVLSHAGKGRGGHVRKAG
jgi:hypothetical protein